MIISGERYYEQLEAVVQQTKGRVMVICYDGYRLGGLVQLIKWVNGGYDLNEGVNQVETRLGYVKYT